MKRGRDEEKMMEPMFPRLHVNETDKGGPRAPPRNKMALYEQLSIPSQRSSHSTMPNNSAVNSEASLIQGSGNERGISRQLPLRHQPDNQSSHHNDFNSPSTQIEQREKLDDDEDDFTVPTFISSFPSQECGRYANDTDTGKLVPPNPSYFNQSLKFQKAAETSRPKSSMRQEGNNQKHENPKEFVAGRVKAVLDSLINETSGYLQKKAGPSPCHEQGVIPSNMIDRLSADDISRSELCTESQSTSNSHNIAVSRENITETDKRNSPDSLRSLSSEDQNIVHDPSNVTESRENRSCGSIHARNLDRTDSVSETSMLDSISGQDAITPDDIVDLIGQKHFWKARRAIANQQRIFAVQVFELHKLIKVQRLIAASPNLLLDDSAYLSKPIKTLPANKLPSEKRHSDKPSHNQEGSIESAIDDTPFPSVKNGVAPLNNQPLSGNYPAPFVNSDHYPGPLCFNQQCLIPVMSPTEGLVYKPYSGSGFMGPGYGGNGLPAPIPLTGNFFNPGYAFPVPPHGYFPPYGMPFMNAAAFPGSLVEKTNPPPMPVQFPADSASAPSEKTSGTSARSAVNGRNGLRAEASDPEVPTQVIKVVPRNARSASESAARIFQSIQEEREQYDLA